MTNEQIIQAAKLAVVAMDEKTRAAFIEAFEEGNTEVSEAIATSFAIEGAQRQIRLCHAALESSRIFEGVCEIVYDKLAS
jgi:hypothetical protein